MLNTNIASSVMLRNYNSNRKSTHGICSVAAAQSKEYEIGRPQTGNFGKSKSKWVRETDQENPTPSPGKFPFFDSGGNQRLPVRVFCLLLCYRLVHMIYRWQPWVKAAQPRSQISSSQLCRVAASQQSGIVIDDSKTGVRIAALSWIRPNRR